MLGINNLPHSLSGDQRRILHQNMGRDAPQKQHLGGRICSLSRLREYLRGQTRERPANPHKIQDRQVALATFNPPHMTAINSAQMSELLLRNSSGPSDVPNYCADLHQDF